MFTRQTVLLVKIESPSGTDAAPEGADNAVMAFDVNLEVKSDMKERGPANDDRSLYPNIRGKTTVDLKFYVELKGSGTAGTAPKWGPLMEACDRAETANAGTNVIYAPAASSETCTIWLYIDGLLHKVTGCAGDYEIDLTAGDVAKLNFTMSGAYALPIDSSMAAPTFNATIPPVVKGTTTTFGSYAAIIEKILLKFGNAVVERTSMNATEGVLAFMVGNRNPTGVMTCEAVVRATSNADFWSYFNTGASKALSLVLGTTAGNIITLTAPACVLAPVKYGDRDGLRLFDVEFQMARSGGNDEMTITLT